MKEFADSGKRAEFETGAVRDTGEGKGRYDLLPGDAIRQLAMVFEVGSFKYGARNWEKGIPLHRFIDSAVRHLCCVLEGRLDEPHLPMAMWNIACAIQTEKWMRAGLLPSSLRDGFPRPIILVGDPPLHVPPTIEVGGANER